MNTEYQEDVNAAQADVIDRIGRKMVDVLDRYARENGYAVVLDSSAQSTPILYASTQIDVTQDIVRLYDQAYRSRPAPQPRRSRPRQSPRRRRLSRRCQALAITYFAGF